MDIASPLGLVLLFLLLGVGIVYDGVEGLVFQNLTYIFDIRSIFIVMGGSLAAVISAYPLETSFRLPKIIAKAFKPPPIDQVNALVIMFDLSKIARKNILRLEDALPSIENTFLRGGLRMLVDRVAREVIIDVMMSEMKYREIQGEDDAKVLDLIATLAPSFGMIGTLFGLIVLLQNLDDPSKIGPAMAIALITTLYGAIIANGIFLPWATKLKTHTREEKIMNEMIRDGVLLIQRGERPEVIESILINYMSPSVRNVYDTAKWGGD